MMAEKLYNDYFAMNERGRAIEQEISNFIEKIVRENSDVNLVELEMIFNQSVGANLAVSRLRHGLNKRKAELNREIK